MFCTHGLPRLCRSFNRSLTMMNRSVLTSPCGKHFYGRMVATSPDTSSSPNHVVYVSQSRCIYENLALEEWLYENGDLENNSYLLMWRNRPAVVIGRHQNAWKECDVSGVLKQGVDLARRRSGGGAVFHDEGNLNISFIKSQPRYNRRENLELVVRAVVSQWDVDLTINKREDIVLDGMFKVSGTAAKLGGHRTYHHFTLLWNVDVDMLNSLLCSTMSGLKSRSTESLIANVRNLIEAAPSMNFNSLVDCIGNEFLQHNKTQDGSRIYVDSISDDSFPGVLSMAKELQQWDWIYGKTPPFNIVKSFTTQLDNERIHFNLNIHFQKGLVHKIEFEMLNQQNVTIDKSQYEPYIYSLVGNRFQSVELNTLFDKVINSMAEHLRTDQVPCGLWIMKCLKKCLICE